MLTHRQTHTGFLIYTVYKRRGGERERKRGAREEEEEEKDEEWGRGRGGVRTQRDESETQHDS